MTQAVLIVGASAAGVQSALELADAGVDVHLVEPSPYLQTNNHQDLPIHLQHTRMLEAARHSRISLRTHTCLETVNGREGDFHVRLRRSPRYVDLARCTACGDCIEVCPVAVPGTNRKAVYIQENTEPGCAVIDKLGTAPCAHACPGGIHVQGYVALIAEGRFREAIDLIREAIPFPGICGRICTHPCEINCRRNDVDAPVSIRLLKRFVSDWEGRQPKTPATSASTHDQNNSQAQKIAVVGAGPAGMTAAGYLNRLGYAVTVFEKLPVIGGMLAVGIPAYRLPRDVIAQEYESILNQGVDIRLNTGIGPGEDYSLQDIFSMGYAAVCLTVGAHKSLSLSIPGEQLPGVVQGIDLLKTISLSQQTDEPAWQERLQSLLPRGDQTQAAILGGGNTAMDVGRTLRRLGLADVRILYRRTRDEMPALKEEIEDAQQEGVQIQLLTAPKEIRGDVQKGVTGIECLRMQLGAPDQSGRRRPVPIQGSEFQLETDLVVLAIGQEPDLDFLEAGSDIAIGTDWRIQVDAYSFMTGELGVFAAGDVVTRTRMSAIDAIGMGKKMARAVDRFLKNGSWPAMVPEPLEKPVAQRDFAPEELTPKQAIPVLEVSVKKRLQGFDEVEKGYACEDAVKEAARCLKCGPCSECLACVSACKADAIRHDQEQKAIDVDVDTVIVVHDPEHAALSLPPLPESIITIPPHDLLMASAAAAMVRADFKMGSSPGPTSALLPETTRNARIGIYICRCGDDMGGVIQSEVLRNRFQDQAQIVHSDVLAYACREEAAETVHQNISDHRLDGVVLAACSCCASEQVCFSCTFQRVRCKKNLGMYGRSLPIRNKAHKDLSAPVKFEFVNIREQCAWVHRDNPEAATNKARILIQGGISKLSLSTRQFSPVSARGRSVMIVGKGPASVSCLAALQMSGLTATHLMSLPAPMAYTDGYYELSRNGQSLKALSVILTPAETSEADKIIDRINPENPWPVARYRSGRIETTRPGIFYCDPELDPDLAGRAAAARCRGWLGRIHDFPKRESGRVDPNRCRMCFTCMDICETGAPQPIRQDVDRHVWIDPAVCTGCGACAANCPSNAISAGDTAEMQLMSMLAEMLSLGRSARE